jgi:lantibiotic modifying enzyme
MVLHENHMTKEFRKFQYSRRELEKVMLDGAVSIGLKICSRSVWYENKCSWIGRTTEEAYNRKLVLFALESDLYSGTSGVALFLGYLYYFTRNDLFRKHALGAINQSISHLSDQYSKSFIRYGFYNGFIGIAYAAAKLGQLLKDNTLLEKSLEILTNLSKDNKTNLVKNRGTDIISGNAGSISALLDIYVNVFYDELIFDLAVSLGEELLSSAVKDRAGYSWNPELVAAGKASHNLTGFAHGTAGIGQSLLELYHRSKNEKFLDGAINAFKYENHWFNRKLENWPDFRLNSFSKYENNGSSNKKFAYANAWCHGAPGIGMSRIRAYHLLGSEQYLNDANSSLRTSLKLLDDKRESWSVSNYSLCHGLSGIGDLLLLSDRVLKSNYRDRLLGIYASAHENYNSNNGTWPCGIPTGETPDLLVGLAGIGYFYLRLHDPKKIPSILIILSQN